MHVSIIRRQENGVFQKFLNYIVKLDVKLAMIEERSGDDPFNPIAEITHGKSISEMFVLKKNEYNDIIDENGNTKIFIGGHTLMEEINQKLGDDESKYLQ